MEITAGELIKSSMRLIGALGNDVVLTQRDHDYPLQALNMLLDSWSNQSLTIWQVSQEIFSLIPAHNPHTWGIGGDFNSPRPVRLLTLKARIPNSVDYDVILMAYDDYAAVQVKTIQSSIQTYAYLDNAYPTANLFLYPVPSIAYQLIAYSEKPIIGPTDTRTVISMPPGYLRALKYALAVEIGDEYKTPASPAIRQQAMLALADIKRTNSRATTLRVDPALLRGGGSSYNIYTNQ